MAEMDSGTMAQSFPGYETILLQKSSFHCPRREVIAHGERLRIDELCYGADTVRIAPHFFIYGPNMAASSGTGGSSAEADGPAMLEAEADLLEALDRLSSAASDAAWQEAVTARDTALRRLLIAVSDMPITDREHVVTRATQALSRELPPPPGPDSSMGGIR